MFRWSAAVRCLLFSESDLLSARRRNDAKGLSRTISSLSFSILPFNRSTLQTEPWANSGLMTARAGYASKRQTVAGRRAQHRLGWRAIQLRYVSASASTTAAWSSHRPIRASSVRSMFAREIAASMAARAGDSPSPPRETRADDRVQKRSFLEFVTRQYVCSNRQRHMCR